MGSPLRNDAGPRGHALQQAPCRRGSRGPAPPRPSAIGHRPSAIGHRPSAVDWRLATGDRLGHEYSSSPMPRRLVTASEPASRGSPLGVRTLATASPTWPRRRNGRLTRVCPQAETQTRGRSGSFGLTKSGTCSATRRANAGVVAITASVDAEPFCGVTQNDDRPERCTGC